MTEEKTPMFIKQVYKHNKWLCLAMILFMAGQLFVNYKHGMVVSPFFHYGMYSHEIKIEKSYPVVEVTINGKLLRGQDYTPQQWDKIMLPIQYYSNIQHSNELYHNEVKRLLQKLSITTNEANFLQQCDEASFVKWYKNYLSFITKEPVPIAIGMQLEINERQYIFNGHILTQTDSLKSLAQLCR